MTDAQPDLVITPATPADADAAARLLRDSITRLCGADHGGDPARIDAWLANKTAANVARWIGDRASTVLVARIGGGPLAGLGVITHTGRITLLYVSPDAVGRGVGTALLQAMADDAARHGCRVLYGESTRTAHAFYRRAGFVDDGAPEIAFGITGQPMRRG